VKQKRRISERMTDTYVISFTEEKSTDAASVGGKGASLGRLTGAGFPVPCGFSVTTAAYRTFLRVNGLQEVLKEAAAGFDHADPEKLEAATAQVRERIQDCEIPADLAEAIRAAYLDLGEQVRVAVRSSGTAEDLAEASFAGQHDSFLDRFGEQDVLAAVRNCWASLWTARATAYRNSKGFDHLDVAMAVVVQRMVDSEISGVLFTGNPMNTANDEMVVNCSWGLGEAVVSGRVEPDEFVVRRRDYAILHSHCGSKTIQVVRDPATGRGTVEVELPAAQASRLCLSDVQLRTLCDLGRRVTDYHDGIPQDLEFGFAGGELYLLQARPITGVAFSWDADLENERWQKYPERPHTLWTRAPADEYLTGAVTPLFYSMRCYAMSMAHWSTVELLGLTEARGVPEWKYYKGVPYNNTAGWESIARHLFPAQLRPLMLQNVDPRHHAEVLAAPSRPINVAKVVARIQLLEKQRGLLAWSNTWEQFQNGTRGGPMDRLSTEQMRTLPDVELIRYLDECAELEAGYVIEVWPVALYFFALSLATLAHMLQHWCRDASPTLLADLITGTEVPTKTTVENRDLWELACLLRESAALQAVFHRHPGAEFFAEVGESEEGRAWLDRYRKFAEENYHRGHQDRDIYYTRRFEDCSIDYPALQALLLAAELRDPQVGERGADERREKAVAQAIAGISRSTLGSVKVEAFKILHGFIMKFLVYRDDQRYWGDHIMAGAKRAALELNDRLVARGVLADRDLFFLGREELQETLRGVSNMKLVRAKIEARRANFEAVLNKTVQRPMYLDGYTPIDLSGGDEDDSSGVLRGMPTSNGTVTGTARVIKSLSEIGRIQSGEILVCNSTDPSWTPVFLLIAGIVAETGGVLAHASCLAREYGLPAVQLRSAMQRIPDGATITVDGSTGTVSIGSDPDGDEGQG
jgi:pyruvate,water dikinase